MSTGQQKLKGILRSKDSFKSEKARKVSFYIDGVVKATTPYKSENNQLCQFIRRCREKKRRDEDDNFITSNKKES